MKDKFNKVKDRQYFYKLVSEHTGCNPVSIGKNWFGGLFIGVPKNWINWCDSFLDKFLEMEKEKTIIVKQLHEKYFGDKK